MHKISSVTVGNFEFTNTPELRASFARIHATMSAKTPSGKQYPLVEQNKMYDVCEVPLGGVKGMIVKAQIEANLLELIHYLNEQGVAVPNITGRARCFSPRTRSLAMRLRLKEVRLRSVQTTEPATQPTSLQPARA